MDNDLFIKMLTKTFHQELTMYILACIISVVSFFIGFKRPSESEKKGKYSKEVFISLSILGFILVLIMAPPNIAAYTHDISNEQFIKAHGVYIFDDTYTSKKSWQYRGSVYFSFDETDLTLKLPAGWSEKEFPNGNYTGTVWYSRESRVILKFIPDVNAGSGISSYSYRPVHMKGIFCQNQTNNCTKRHN